MIFLNVKRIKIEFKEKKYKNYWKHFLHLFNNIFQFVRNEVFYFGFFFFSFLNQDCKKYFLKTHSLRKWF